jgi:hypothetical protein
VHQAAGVRRIQGLGHLRDDVDGPRGRQRTVALQQFGQVDTTHQRHVDVELAVDLAVVVDRDDVRLGQPRGELRFPAESRLERGVRAEPGRQALERHRPLSNRVERPKDLPHTSDADEFFQSVRAELLLRHEDRPPPTPVGLRLIVLSAVATVYGVRARG